MKGILKRSSISKNPSKPISIATMSIQNINNTLNYNTYKSIHNLNETIELEYKANNNIKYNKKLIEENYKDIIKKPRILNISDIINTKLSLLSENQRSVNYKNYEKAVKDIEKKYKKEELNINLTKNSSNAYLINSIKNILSDIDMEFNKIINKFEANEEAIDYEKICIEVMEIVNSFHKDKRIYTVLIMNKFSSIFNLDLLKKSINKRLSFDNLTFHDFHNLVTGIKEYHGITNNSNNEVFIDLLEVETKILNIKYRNIIDCKIFSTERFPFHPLQIELYYDTVNFLFANSFNFISYYNEDSTMQKSYCFFAKKLFDELLKVAKLISANENEAEIMFEQMNIEYNIKDEISKEHFKKLLAFYRENKYEICLKITVLFVKYVTNFQIIFKTIDFSRLKMNDFLNFSVVDDLVKSLFEISYNSIKYEHEFFLMKSKIKQFSPVDTAIENVIKPIIYELFNPIVENVPKEKISPNEQLKYMKRLNTMLNSLKLIFLNNEIYGNKISFDENLLEYILNFYDLFLSSKSSLSELFIINENLLVEHLKGKNMKLDELTDNKLSYIGLLLDVLFYIKNIGSFLVEENNKENYDNFDIVVKNIFNLINKSNIIDCILNIDITDINSKNTHSYKTKQKILSILQSILEYTCMSSMDSDVSISKHNDYIQKELINIFSKLIPIHKEFNSPPDFNYCFYYEFTQKQISITLLNIHHILECSLLKTSSNLKLKNQIEYYFSNCASDLRLIKGHELLKFNNPNLLNVNTISQIITNFQTVECFKNNSDLSFSVFSMTILTAKKYKEFVMNVCNKLQDIKKDAAFNENYLLTNYNNKNRIEENSQSHQNISLTEYNNLFNFSNFSTNIGINFNLYSDNEIGIILNVIESNSMIDYNPLFLDEIQHKYDFKELIKIKNNNIEIFFKIVLNWPIFLKNDGIVKSILSCKKSQLLQFERFKIIKLLYFNSVKIDYLFELINSNIPNIKNSYAKRNLFSDYIYYVFESGYELSAKEYNNVLEIYKSFELEYINLEKKANTLSMSNSIMGKSNFINQFKDYLKVIKFSDEELTDIITVGINSKVKKSELKQENHATLLKLVNKVMTNFNSSSTVMHKGIKVKFDFSIESEERNYTKSTIQTTGIIDYFKKEEQEANQVSHTKKDINKEEEEEKMKKENKTEGESEKEDIADKERDKDNIDQIIDLNLEKKYGKYNTISQDSILKSFDSYFIKKKTAIYGNSNYLVDENIDASYLVKKWCIALLYKYEISETYFSKFENINTQLKEIQESAHYKDLFFKLMSFTFNNNYSLETKYEDPSTKIKVDFYLKNLNNTTDKNVSIFYIPSKYIIRSIKLESNEIPDLDENGINKLLHYTLINSSIKNSKIIKIFEEESAQSIEDKLLEIENYLSIKKTIQSTQNMII